MTDIEIITRIALSVLVGGIIGFEREQHRRAAGLRTHILVCVGSTVITLTSLYISDHYSGLSQNCDPSRIAAGIITGIGFLGAGTIIRFKASVLGLTTAASLWGVAGLGIALGSGFYKGAIYGTIAIFLTLIVLGKFKRRYMGAKDAQPDISNIED